MKHSFDASVSRVLAHEGGYTNHPKDPGGPTNWGITLTDARLYWRPRATAADVQAMPRAVAVEIYRKRYWDVLRCDELPAGLDYSMFDYGVNSGVGRAGKVLRRLLGLAVSSSSVTDDVIAAVKRRDPAQLIAALNDERLRFLKSLRTWPVFGRGWGRRVAEVRSAALAMAGARPPVRFADGAPVVGRGTPNAPPVATVFSGSAAVGIAGVGASNPFEWIAAHPWTAAAIVIVAVIVAIVIAELVMRRHERRVCEPMAGTSVVPEMEVAKC